MKQHPFYWFTTQHAVGVLEAIFVCPGLVTVWFPGKYSCCALSRVVLNVINVIVVIFHSFAGPLQSLPSASAAADSGALSMTLITKQGQGAAKNNPTPKI